MNIKIATQVVAGLFAVATTWLTVAYAKQSWVDREKTETISGLENRVKRLESQPVSAKAEFIKQRVLDILSPKSGALDRLRQTVRRLKVSGTLTEDQQRTIDEIAQELDEIDSRLEKIARSE
jgi:ABC-type phosphate transport system auxiliary subunit